MCERLANSNHVIIFLKSYIKTPGLVLVSGDFVAGVKLTAPDASAELTRQYTDAETFLFNRLR